MNVEYLILNYKAKFNIIIKEMINKVYVVTINRLTQDYLDELRSDKAFIAEAEKQGTAYSLSEFQNAFNNNLEFSQEDSYIRIIGAEEIAPTPETVAENILDKYLYGYPWKYWAKENAIKAMLDYKNQK